MIEIQSERRISEFVFKYAEVTHNAYPNLINKEMDAWIQLSMLRAAHTKVIVHQIKLRMRRDQI